jgi:hypothetical protein
MAFENISSSAISTQHSPDRLGDQAGKRTRNFHPTDFVKVTLGTCSYPTAIAMDTTTGGYPKVKVAFYS